MKSLILDALSKLNPGNDKHWTTEGLPLVDAVRALAGDNDLTRSEISEAAPNFDRENRDLPMMSEPEKLMEMSEENLSTEEKGELIAWLKAQIAEKLDAHGKLLSKQDQLDKQFKEIEKKRLAFETKLRRIDPPPTNQEEIQLYLETQRKQRIKDHENAKDLPQDPRSPLDRSFRRDNQRPQVAM